MSTRYTEDHEWAKQDGELIVVGITDFAQQQLGEVVFVDLPGIDQEVTQGEEAAVVESVKAAGEVKAPVAGTVVEINEALADDPELVNNDPAGSGWFYKLRPAEPGQFDDLMTEQDYASLIQSLA